MQRNVLLAGLLMVVFLFSLIILWKGYTAFAVHQTIKLYNKIKDRPAVFCYDVITSAKLNSAMVTDDEYNANAIATYYERINKDDNWSSQIDFPIKFANYQTRFYVVERLKNGVSKVMAFDTLCWGSNTVYLSDYCIHSALPSSKLIAEEEVFWVEKEKSTEYRRTKRNISKVRTGEYGCQYD